MIHQHFFARFHLGDCQRRLSNVGRQDDVRPGASNDGANLDDGLNGGKKKTHKFSKIGKQQIPNTAGEFWKQKNCWMKTKTSQNSWSWLYRWNACHVHLIWAQKKNPQPKLLILIWNLAFLLMFQGNCTPSGGQFCEWKWKPPQLISIVKSKNRLSLVVSWLNENPFH